ncbi:hypothetical protein ISS05_01490 [Candidatus Woesearchaeota archaeon]|nr:hypothetical protein [Candidatus Woesearchaeota archaeon]
MPELNNIFFTKETINRIYQRRSYLTSLLKDIFLTPKQKRFQDIVQLPNHWEYETIFQCIMESWLINKNKKMEYEELLKNNITKENIDLSSELYKIRPLENLNILEIGGYFAVNLEKLGCKAIKKDSAIEEKEHISLDNYKEQLEDNSFDISLSKEVFDQYSGIDDNKEFDKASKELLAVFSKVTKKDGMTIHEGSITNIIKDKAFLDSIGLKLICILEGKRIGPVYDVYIFKKIS